MKTQKKIGKKLGVDWDLLACYLTKQTIWPKLEGHWLAVLLSRF